jgi:hypothetical protein
MKVRFITPDRHTIDADLPGDTNPGIDVGRRHRFEFEDDKALTGLYEIVYSVPVCGIIMAYIVRTPE